MNKAGERRKQSYRNFEELAAHSPFLRQWEIACASEGGGEAVLRMTVRETHLNSVGIVHGGVIASLADSACGIALLSAIRKGSGFVTTSLNIDYIGGPKGGGLEARARVRAVRKRAAFVGAEVFDDLGTLLATATVVFYVSAAEGDDV